jgi:hypothetical protein
MITMKTRESKPDIVLYIMSDQPDCCPACQKRLDLVEIVMMDNERVFVEFCEECQREVLIVEN